MGMIERIKWNVFVFFARIRTKKRIKSLKSDLESLGWYIGVEKNESEEIWQQYERTKTLLLTNEITLKGLVYS